MSGTGGATQQEGDRVIPELRDLFQSLRRRITEAKDSHQGIEPSFYDGFILDFAHKVPDELEALSAVARGQRKPGITALLDDSRRCRDLLRSARLKESYQLLLTDIRRDPYAPEESPL